MREERVKLPADASIYKIVIDMGSTWHPSAESLVSRHLSGSPARRSLMTELDDDCSERPVGPPASTMLGARFLPAAAPAVSSPTHADWSATGDAGSPGVALCWVVPSPERKLAWIVCQGRRALGARAAIATVERCGPSQTGCIARCSNSIWKISCKFCGQLIEAMARLRRNSASSTLLESIHRSISCEQNLAIGSSGVAFTRRCSCPATVPLLA